MKQFCPGQRFLVGVQSVVLRRVKQRTPFPPNPERKSSVHIGVGVRRGSRRNPACLPNRQRFLAQSTPNGCYCNRPQSLQAQQSDQHFTPRGRQKRGDLAGNKIFTERSAALVDDGHDGENFLHARVQRLRDTASQVSNQGIFILYPIKIPQILKGFQNSLEQTRYKQVSQSPFR